VKRLLWVRIKQFFCRHKNSSRDEFSPFRQCLDCGKVMIREVVSGRTH
jgi:hypothetical protein